MTYSNLAEGLVKRFGDTVALDGIDLAVRTGSVFGVDAVLGGEQPGLIQAGDGRAEIAVGHVHQGRAAPQRAQPGSADVEHDPRVVIGADLKRPEHGDLHSSIVPDPVTSARVVCLRWQCETMPV